MRRKRWIMLAMAMAFATGITDTSLAASFKVLHTFNSSTDGAGPRGALILDKAGNLYGTTSNGGLCGGGDE